MAANRDRTDEPPHQHAQGKIHSHVEDGRFEARKRRSQGIVRDQRGQDQPADKERAQRVSKSD